MNFLIHHSSRTSAQALILPIRILFIAALLAGGLIGTVPSLQAAPWVDPTPSVSLGLPASVWLGEDFTFTATFDNSGDQTGYGPFIDLIFPVNGADGAADTNPPLDGVDFLGATYLGTLLTTVVQTFPSVDDGFGNYCVNHPYAVYPGPGPTPTPGSAQQVCGTPGDKLVTIQLPFGSFTVGQPPAAVTVSAHMSNLADLPTALNIRARGGFQFGATPLNDWCCAPFDATILSSPSSASSTWPGSPVTPTLFTLTKTYQGPEDETATGPNFPRRYTLTVDIATGQTLNNLDINDLLPNNMQYLSLISSTPATTAVSTPSTITPGGTLTRRIAAITGTASTADVVIEFEFYIPQFNASSIAVIAPLSGAAVQSQNRSWAAGTWTPFDVRDTPGPVSTDGTCPGCPPLHTLNDRSIAIQKSVANVIDVGAVGNTPGDTLLYTIEFQVSDFFAFQDINITDIISDGQHVDTSFVPEMSIEGNGYSLVGQDMDGANVDIACNYTGGPLGECDTDNPASNTGQTTIVFNVSDEIILRGETGRMIGGCVPVAGTGGPTPDCVAYNNGPTTGTITFRTIIQDEFTDDHLLNGHSGDASVDHGDTLENDITIRGALLSVTDTDNPIPGTFVEDTSGADILIAFGALDKSVYAYGPAPTTACASQPCTNVQVRPADVVTYRLRYTQPSSDFEETVFTDYLPLPVFNATELTTFSNTVCGIPAAGTACYGPADTFHVKSGATAPGLATNAADNLVTFTYPAYDDPTNTSSVIDILFTVTVSSDPFADGLFLTNQARVEEGTTNAGDQTVDAIVQIQLLEPVLVSDKAVVASTRPSASFIPATVGPVAFNTPGTGGARWTGVINSTNLATSPINSNVSGVDAGDIVTFAIVIENTGLSTRGAFDITIQDSIPAGFVMPSGGYNLRIANGDNSTSFGYTLPNGSAATASDLFATGIKVADPGAPGTGACQAHNASNGLNILVITYDLQLDVSVAPNQVLTNTGSLLSYSGSEGGPNHLPEPQTDTATTTIRSAALGKVLVGTELNNAANSNTQAVIGEYVTYQLTLTVPEGTMPGAVINDTLDSGLAFVDVQSVTSSPGLTMSTPITTGNSPANVTVGDAGSGQGNQVDFSLGTVTNTDTDNAVTETIVIVYRAVVLDVFANQGGTLLNNAAMLSWTGNGPQSQITTTANITVIEPSITTAKTASSGPYDAGNVITFSLLLTNGNAAADTDAYNITLSDVVPASFTYLPASMALGTCTAGSTPTLNDAAPTTTGLTATFASFAKNTSCTITFDATINYTVIPGQSLPNTANTIWTSLPGTVVNRSIYNPASDERTGSTSGPTFGNGNAGDFDDYHSLSTLNLTVSSVAKTKYLVATSETFTSDSALPFTGVNAPPSAAIGEVLRYRIIAQLPEGTISNFQLTDTLPTGLTFIDDDTARVAFISNGTGISSTDVGSLPVPAINSVSCTVSGNSANGSTPAAPLPCLLAENNIGSTNSTSTNVDTYNAGTDPIFKVGDLVNNDNDSDAEFVVIEFNVVVNNSASNNTGTNIDNTFTVNASNTGAANVRVVVVEPSITNVDKTASPTTGDADDVINFTVTFSNPTATNAITAFETQLLDTLPATYVLNVSSVNVTLGGGASGITNSSSGNTVDVTIGTIPLGGTVQITYSASLTEAVTPSQVITNTANLTYTSLPGAGTTSNPTGSNTPGASGAATGERNGNNSGPNDYLDNDIATVTVPTLAVTKFNVATSETHTTDPRVAIGEIVRFRLVTRLPEGTVTNFQLLDNLPTGLTFLNDGSAKVAFVYNNAGSITSSDFASTETIPAIPGGCNVTGNTANGTTPLSSSITCVLGDGNISTSATINADTYASGTDVRFKLGTLVNNDNDLADDEFVIVEFNALVDNSVSGTNDAGDNRNNNFAASINGVSNGGTSANVTVTVSEPSITNVNKTATPITGDAGDTISFSITYSNANGANNTTAFNAHILDALPSGYNLNLGSITSTLGGGATGFNDASSGNTVDVSVDVVPLGGTVQIDYTATISGAVAPGQVINNTADLTYTSLPGTGTTGNPTGSTTPGASGAANGERDGGGTAPNDYLDSDSASVTVDEIAPLKTIATTSEGTATDPQVLVGEVVRYHLAVQIPEATSLNFQITDRLPGGLKYIAGSARLALVGNENGVSSSTLGISPQVTGNSGTVTPTYSIPGAAVSGGANDGDDVTFSLGDIVNTDSDIDAEYVVIEFNAVVSNIGGNQSGTTRTNDFQVYIGGSLNSTSTTVDVIITEPVITNLAKTVDTAPTDAGDIVVYSLTYSNTATGPNRANAYDVAVTDDLDDNLDLLSVLVTAPVGSTVTDTSSLGVSGTVLVSINQLPPAADLTGVTGVTITVTARVISSAPNGQIITNSADLVYTSLPGNGTPGNPTGSNTPGTSGASDGERNGGGGVNDYNDTSNTVSNTLAAPLVDKRTPDPTSYTIGDAVTYDILITLPEGVTQSLSVTDVLPAGLQYISNSIVTTTAGSSLLAANYGGTPGTPTVTGGAFNGDDVTFTFGDVTTVDDNATNNNAFVLRLLVRVLNIFPGNQTGTSLANSASMTYTNSNTGNPVTVTDPTAPSNITLVEPRIATDKTVVPTTGVEAGDVLTYTVIFSNTGTSTAYEVTATDTLAQGTAFTSLTSCILNPGATDITGGTTADTSVAGQVTFSGAPWDIVVGGDITCTYSVTAQNSLNVDGSHTNTVDADWTSQNGTANTHERTYNDTTAYIVDGTQDTDTASFTVDSIAFDKSDGGVTTATIGDSITYTLTITSPLGTIRSLVINDVLPVGLTYNVGSYVVNGISTPPTFGTTGSGPTTLTWDFGDAVVTSSPATITFTATVANVTGNQAGTTRTNNATLDYVLAGGTPGGQLSDSDPVTIIEPEITTDKSVSPTSGVEAGDVVTYTVVFTNTGNSPAHEVSVTDVLAQGMSFTSLTSCILNPGAIDLTGSTTVNTGVAGQVTLSGSTWDIAVGGSITCIYTTTAQNTLTIDGTHTNTADADWTSQNGTANTGERTYDDSVTYTVDGTQDTDTASFTVDGVTLDKTDGGVTEAAVGETIHYTLTITSPLGTIRGLDVNDLLPANLTYVPGSYVVTGISTVPAFTATGTGPTTLNWNFGDALVTSSPATITFDAVVDDEAGNQIDTVVTNNATLDYLLAGGTPHSQLTDDDSFTITEPELEIVKAVSPVLADSDGTVTYTLTISHVSGSNATAYDLIITDPLTANTTLDVGSVTTTAGTIVLGNTTGDTTVQVNVPSLISGDTITITFDAIVGQIVEPGDVITNTAEVDWDSLSGTGGRTGSDTDPATVTINSNAISGFVYHDADNDGLKDGSETGIENVTVNLTGTDHLGNPVSETTTTDSDGYYEFTGLRPGDYTVTESQPAGYIDGKDTEGTPFDVEGAVTNDSFVTIAIELGSNTTGVNYNFGEVLVASLSGYVYEDDNNDGIFDSGEAPIELVDIALTGTDDLGAAVNLTTQTDSNGYYEFINLRPGTYVITETQPGGYLDGQDTIGSQGGTTGSDTFTAIALDSGENGTENNFGELLASSLSGYVYHDVNNDGVFDSGEPGIANVTVTLTGTDDLGSVSLSTTTNVNGYYEFTDLRPGTYVITETQPGSYLDGLDTIGTPGGDDSVNDVFSNIVLPTDTHGTDNNFGEIQGSGLSGFVYEDDDNDGIKDGGEAGIGSVTVTLTGTDDLGSVSLSTTTAGDGSYSFPNLRPGTYTVTETHPTAYLDGKDTIGTPSGGGSTGNDVFSNITLGQNEFSINNNFGELQPANLSGYVYLDDDNDGNKDGSEVGLSGVTITLSGTDDLGNPVNDSTTTDGSGYYEFTDLRPGTYIITETQPNGYGDGIDSIGTPGGTTGSDEFSAIGLNAGVDGTNNNFGEIPSSISGRVYVDADNDGNIDGGETGIAGVTITLTGTDVDGGSVNLTTTTAVDGTYSFENLKAGDYTVTETQPGAYSDGIDSAGSEGGDDSTTNDVISDIDLGAGVNATDYNFGELASADLSVVKSVNDDTPLIGQNVIFTVVVSNGGPNDTSGVTVDDVLPAGYAFISATVTQGNYSSSVWTVGALANGASATLNITATVNAAGPYDNTAEVTASLLSDPDSTPDNGDGNEDDQDTVVVTPVQAVDLSVTKTVDNSSPTSGDTITYTVTVLNSGPNDATGVEVTDVLPGDVTYSADTPSQGDYDEGTGVWTVGALANGASATLQIEVVIDTNNAVTNTAQVSAADQADPDSTPGNDDGSEDDQASVTTQQGTADLRLTKEVDNATPQVGQNVTFTITLTNDGPDDATNVVVSDLLPAGYTFVSANPAADYTSGTGLWDVGSLANGASTSLDITATVNTGGPFLNTAQVSEADQNDPDSTPNNSLPEDDQDTAAVTPVQVADLSLTKTVDEPSPAVGDTIVYTLSVHNDGPSVATNVSLRDNLPSGVDFVSASAGCSESGGVVTCTVASIAIGGTQNFTITATVNSSGSYDNVAQVSASDQLDTDSTPNNDDGSEDDQDGVTVTPPNISDLSLTKTVDASTPLVNTNVVFTITVTNDGSMDTTGVTVVDLLPSGYSYVSSTASQGSYVSGTGVWTVGALAATDDATLSITANVNVSGTYVNTAEITASDRPDSDSTPNNGTGNGEDDQDNETVTPIPLADLTLNKTVNTTSPIVGTNVVFTITLVNNGPSTATNVAVRDPMPAGMTFVTSSASQGSYSSGTGIWTVGTMNNGATVTLQVTATAATVGTKINTAQVSASDQLDSDSEPNNDDASEDDQDSVTVGAIFDPPSGLKVLNSVGLPELEWRMVWISSGNTSAINVQIADGIPAGSTYVAGSLVCEPRGTSSTSVCQFDSSNNRIFWQGVMGPDSGATNEATAVNEVVLTFRVSVNSGVTQVNNQATSLTDINGDGSFSDETTQASVSDSNVATWQAAPTATNTPTRTNTPVVATSTAGPSATPATDPAVTKSVNPSQIVRGETITFTLVVRNNASSTMTNVVVSDSFPSTLDITSATTTRGTTAIDAATRTVTASIGTMNSGESVTIVIAARANTSLVSTTDQTNTATMTYVLNNTSLTRFSNTVSYRLVGGATLPSSGEDISGPSLNIWLLIISIILAFVGGGLYLYGAIARSKRWVVYVGSGVAVALLASGLGFAAFVPAFSSGGVVASAAPASQTAQPTQAVQAISASPTPAATLAPEDAPLVVDESAWLPGVEPTLPAYPTPTPPVVEVAATPLPESAEVGLDTTSVTRIVIPALNVDAKVKYVPFDGLTWPLTGLRTDIAWLGDTSWPGLGSNTVLAGHVTVKGVGAGPFFQLNKLQPGDSVMVYTEMGMYTYVVREKEVVTPDAIEVTGATAGAQLTLITCTGWDAESREYDQRLVVFADLVTITTAR